MTLLGCVIAACATHRTLLEPSDSHVHNNLRTFYECIYRFALKFAYYSFVVDCASGKLLKLRAANHRVTCRHDNATRGHIGHFPWARAGTFPPRCVLIFLKALICGFLRVRVQYAVVPRSRGFIAQSLGLGRQAQALHALPRGPDPFLHGGFHRIQQLLGAARSQAPPQLLQAPTAVLSMVPYRPAPPPVAMAAATEVPMEDIQSVPQDVLAMMLDVGDAAPVDVLTVYREPQAANDRMDVDDSLAIQPLPMRSRTPPDVIMTDARTVSV